MSCHYLVNTLSFSSLDYRIDAQYYYNKYLISVFIWKHKNRRHLLKPLSYYLDNMSAGKSPTGGVTRSVGEIPSVTISNITATGDFNFTDDLNFVPQHFYDLFRLSKPALKLNSILIAKDGATTGKSALIDSKFPFIEDVGEGKEVKAIYSEHIFNLSIKNEFNPVYIHAFLNSTFGKLQMDSVITGGAQGGITTGFVDKIMIPKLTEESQAVIADAWRTGMNEVHRLRAQADGAEEMAMSNLDRVMLELE